MADNAYVWSGKTFSIWKFFNLYYNDGKRCCFKVTRKKIKLKANCFARCVVNKVAGSASNKGFFDFYFGK